MQTTTLTPITIATELCQYCFNLDHWVPVRLITAAVECKRCETCPMYVPVGEWEEHEGHNPQGWFGKPSEVVTCSECPICSGVFAPCDPGNVTECRYCADCQSYVPSLMWEMHQESNCGNEGNPF